MENTYWNEKGTYCQLNVELEKLIPAIGPVDKPSKNKALERYRKASNAYYDIFNNGGGNRPGAIRAFFGFGMSSMKCGGDYNWNLIHHIVEPIMDQIILAAAKEQDIRDWDAEAAQNDYEKEFA